MSHEVPPGLGEGTLEDFLDVFTNDNSYQLEIFHKTVLAPNIIERVTAGGYTLYECFALFQNLAAGEYLVTYADGRTRTLFVAEDGDDLQVPPPDYYEPTPDPSDPEEMTWPPLTFRLQMVIRRQKIENEDAAVCAPLDSMAKQYRSRQCFTAVCPPGSLGEPVTRCAEATSDTSQADADAKALAAAQELAEEDLVCTALPNVEDEALLNLTLLGEYDIEALEEDASLVLSLLGTYGLGALEDDALLEITLSGELLLVPLVDAASLTVSLSQVSSYQLNALSDNAILFLTLSGSYVQVIGAPQSYIDRASLVLSLSGAYVDNVQSRVATENASLVLTLSGTYVESVKLREATENALLTLTLSGDYVDRVREAGTFTERSSLQLSLSGSYHT